jgi:dGTPase
MPVIPNTLRNRRLEDSDPHQAGKSSKDQRTSAQHDRDRILHTTAFRRLSDVTQVVNPREGQVYHNRLTHTLKVAQVGRRIAERLLSDKSLTDVINRLGGLDPDVVEAAALAHDLGHPPFAHTGETVLKELVQQYNADGFEGNAQSFRIVTKLAISRINYSGLNLSRATLRAILKYPWYRGAAPNPDYNTRYEKWGVYRSEKKYFEAVQELRGGPEKGVQSLEAAIMDLADDIAYATHDVEDFYRAGLIPLHHLWPQTVKVEAYPTEQFLKVFSAEADAFLAKVAKFRNLTVTKVRETFQQVAYYFQLLEAPYRGIEDQKRILHTLFGTVIDNYANMVTIEEDDGVAKLAMRDYEQQPADDVLLEIKIYKDLTRFYVHNHSPLKTQQFGERRILTDLFNIYFAAYGSDQDSGVLPEDYQELRDRTFKEESGFVLPASDRNGVPLATIDQALCARLAADYITRMTEAEARQMHSRLTGTDLGSFVDNAYIG